MSTTGVSTGISVGPTTCGKAVSIESASWCTSTTLGVGIASNGLSNDY